MGQHYDPMQVPWKSHGSMGLPWVYSVSMSLPCDFQGFIVLAHRTPMGLPWACGASHDTPMGLTWDFHGSSMGLHSQCSHGPLLVLPSKSHGTSVGVSYGSTVLAHGTPTGPHYPCMVLPWDLHGTPTGLPCDFHGTPIGIPWQWVRWDSYGASEKYQ